MSRQVSLGGQGKGCTIPLPCSLHVDAAATLVVPPLPLLVLCSLPCLLRSLLLLLQHCVLRSIVSFLRVLPSNANPDPTLTSPMVASTKAATSSITARIFFSFF